MSVAAANLMPSPASSPGLVRPNLSSCRARRAVTSHCSQSQTGRPAVTLPASASFLAAVKYFVAINRCMHFLPLELIFLCLHFDPAASVPYANPNTDIKDLDSGQITFTVKIPLPGAWATHKPV
ncbi:hypothetical protein RRG08_044800 [Elysia crispata]|uniref:Uncharacterized protein n=1 Tax=Elysia crispata TaxID=231223 RepID=A0AAE0ZUD8_9GAST|nr:hypothetical protein RRG08_044800 [Elysia crispata]